MIKDLLIMHNNFQYILKLLKILYRILKKIPKYWKKMKCYQ